MTIFDERLNINNIHYELIFRSLQIECIKFFDPNNRRLAEFKVYKYYIDIYFTIIFNRGCPESLISTKISICFKISGLFSRKRTYTFLSFSRIKETVILVKKKIHEIDEGGEGEVINKLHKGKVLRYDHQLHFHWTLFVLVLSCFFFKNSFHQIV